MKPSSSTFGWGRKCFAVGLRDVALAHRVREETARRTRHDLCRCGRRPRFNVMLGLARKGPNHFQTAGERTHGRPFS